MNQHTPRSRERSLNRFLAKVQFTDACWLWMACLDQGYGRFRDGPRYYRAHRWLYEFIVGPIEPMMTLDHLCHNADECCVAGNSCQHRRCVNPDHLEQVSSKVNTLRGRAITALLARKTHCKHGHPFTPENTTILTGKRPGRECRACRKAYENTHPEEIRKAKRDYRLRKRTRPNGVEVIL